MELLKMMSQILTHEEKYKKESIQNKIFNFLKPKDKKDNLSINKQNKNIEKNHKVIKLDTLRVLFSTSHSTLEVLNNGNKESISLFDLKDISADQKLKKDIQNILNETLKKTNVYYKVINNEYILYKNPDDISNDNSINSFILNSFVNINKKEVDNTLTVESNNLLNDNKNEEIKSPIPTKEVKNIEDIKTGVGIIEEFGLDHYMFDKTKSKSFFISLKNEHNILETWWGTDLKRLAEEKNILTGYTISIKNLGTEQVQSGGKTIFKKNFELLILDKNNIEVIKKDNLTTQTTKTKKNCYCIELKELNYFSCMLDSKHQTFNLNLNGFDLSTVSSENITKIKNSISAKIEKKVIYLSLNENNTVDIFSNLNTDTSINSEIISLLEPLVKNSNIELINKNIELPTIKNNIEEDIFNSEMFNIAEDITPENINLENNSEVNYIEESTNKLMIGGKPVVLNSSEKIKKLQFGKPK